MKQAYDFVRHQRNIFRTQKYGCFNSPFQKILTHCSAISQNFWRPNEITYRKVVSSNTSHLEAHAGFFRMLMKGIFDAYVLGHFDKKIIFELVTRVSIPGYHSPYMVFSSKQPKTFS